MATTIEPVTPGYYQSDLRKLSFSELRRFALGGTLGAVMFSFLRYTIKVPPEGNYLPMHWQDLVVAQDMLSNRAVQTFGPKIAELEALGFTLVAYHRLFKHLFPLQVDNGAAYFLHSSGNFVASLPWTVNRQPAPMIGEKEVLANWFFTACPSGKVVSVSNTGMYMDPPAPREVVALPGISTQELWQRIQKERARLDAAGEGTKKFSDVATLEEHYNEQEALTYHVQVNVRKVLVRLTDAQVAQGEQRFL
ncbi:hypothetical protein [Armatimonas sp.]|uniref:hypothetical protein n=1 Tax=Armatimonas sp. TaxID=1872638 RepID=UPI00286BA8FA|nr:hypothetical protein [Armatimonas sp.]